MDNLTIPTAFVQWSPIQKKSDSYSITRRFSKNIIARIYATYFSSFFLRRIFISCVALSGEKKKSGYPIHSH